MDGWQKEFNGEKEVIGYKLFNADFTNRYGIKFEEGQSYVKEGNIRFGLKGNGFHFCKNFEDTFRYFDSSEGFILTMVKGSGKMVEYCDDYYEYYDMYACSNLEILKVISREEIIEMAKKISYNKPRLIRFIQLFYLTDEEESEIMSVAPYAKKYIDLYKPYKEERRLEKVKTLSKDE